MNVLEIGGSGFVGRLINPCLKQQHRLVVYDRVPPGDSTIDFVQGSVASADDLQRASQGMDAVVYLAMGRDKDGGNQEVASSYDVNVRGVHECLEAAANAGVRRAVYASTLSIYNHYTRRAQPLDSEDTQGDAPDIYGFTKRLGEEVCEYFARTREMTCISLRCCGPSTDEDWERNPNSDRYGQTKASDLGRAFNAALTCRAQGFVPIFVTGDATDKVCKLTRAREVLGWEPTRKLQPSNGSAPAPVRLRPVMSHAI
ncbi:MAG: hypothetical protein AUJ92_05395 [Armatimonadetes bacterium CG2_30_59_28]|nr:NAD(P)-dependent oxidoreductase [Armatimonadota bacterium]OIO96706.1 MAG: hypothetical protein AUJ92_05395 [Armatimonadetes bacterium CG2_30_59_28]PIU63898.1 MAG: hypothetical protein COS85_14600 [Armatimonadetes bacterium CG07_land_8_20_14_0_80_59_28]PIX44134.1 MAG: hypothetical protein COZ56_05430 [Armatimonadetes bacterium CG_4_8_14_3_um_filter_58_9]PIY45945.1 MAG: hypothetical protein COZ05_06085 [Armatimonadetes bacterium CG_4_10_14_3_um_filter_59_10]PJB61558.1 MAG: hypothetical protei